MYCYCLLTAGHAQGDTGHIIIATLLLSVPNDIQIVATTGHIFFFTDYCPWILHIQWELPCQLHLNSDFFFSTRSQYIVQHLHYSMFHQPPHSVPNRCNEWLKYIKTHTPCVCSYTMLCAEGPCSNYIISCKSDNVVI